jgi:hypothetical protein
VASSISSDSLTSVRVTALQRLDDADLVLAQLERTLKEKGVDLDKALDEVINSGSGASAYNSLRSAGEAPKVTLVSNEKRLEIRGFGIRGQWGFDPLGSLPGPENSDCGRSY